MGNKKSKLLMPLFWITTIGCFVFGYYNAAYGLETFEMFDSRVGSWFMALIPLVMVFGGFYAAVQGKRGLFAVYLLGEVIFFVFNMTYLYPQYLGRKIVQEETKELSDSLTVYNTRINQFAFKDLGKAFQTYNDLITCQDNLITEIRDRNGFGKHATEQLSNFNKLIGSEYGLTPERNKVNLPKVKADSLANVWREKTNQQIDKFIMANMQGGDSKAKGIYEVKMNVNALEKEYSPILSAILKDRSKIEIIPRSEVENNEQIQQLITLAEELNNQVNIANTVMAPQKIFEPIIFDEETIAFPKVRELGTFQHTFISAGERINKLDTWGVIIVCLFFDLLGPCLFYLYLRKSDDGDDYSYSGDNSGGWGDDPWWKKIFK